MDNTNQAPSVGEHAQNVLRQFNVAPSSKNMKMFVIVGVLVVALGVGGGFLLSGKGSVIGTSTNQVVPGSTKTANEAGIADEKTFKDTATGVLKEGGIKGEGTHHLEVDGGPSKSVYLTSTVIDLQGFVGKKVQVWGQTVTPRFAGWLMDVGKVKVVE